MMVPSRFWSSLALLGVVANAQLASYSKNGVGIDVNVPASTSSGSSNTIYMRITASSGTQWVGFGQGSSMSGSNMFVVYQASDTNVTVSPRLGKGYNMPNFNSAAQISVLDGTGITPQGDMVANIRCDNCLTWDGGSMDATDSSSNWIWGIKSGSALNSASTSESIQMHDGMGGFKLDLTQGTGGSSSNPFISSASTSGGAAPSASSASSTPTSNPDSGSSSGSSSGGYSPSSNTSQVRSAHAVIMSLVFLVLFPVGALTIYLPYAEKVRYIHGPLQVLALLLTIIGLALGIVLAQRFDEVDGYHQIIGYLIVAVLILFQPALGIVQHLHFRKTGGGSPMGIIHRWLGRTMIILGIINGGLGFMQSGPVGSQNVPSYSVVAYCIVAGVVLFVYLSVLLATSWRAKHKRQTRVGEKFNPDRERGGYQMQHSPQNNGHPFATPPQNTYTISHPDTGYGRGQTYR